MYASAAAATSLEPSEEEDTDFQFRPGAFLCQDHVMPEFVLVKIPPPPLAETAAINLMPSAEEAKDAQLVLQGAEVWVQETALLELE